MKQRGKLLDRMALAVDLPGEALPGVPLVEIAGDGRVLIENHRGVVLYDTCMIRVRVKYGQIHICGSELRIAQMTRHQIVIVGRVDSVALCRGGGR